MSSQKLRAIRFPSKAAAFLLAASLLTLPLSGCADKTTNSTAKYKALSDEDTTLYQIGLLASQSSEREDAVEKGFRDALTDTLGEKHYKITVVTADADNSAFSLASKMVNRGSAEEESGLTGKPSSEKASSYDLLAASGANALSALADNTTLTPIVGMDVLSFQKTLHLNTDSWNDPTGINVTGISSKIPLADYVSLMIEATPNLTGVGILYSPEDQDAISQNEVIEKYLDEAGIPWCEYELLSSDSARAAMNASNTSGEEDNVISPDRISAPNSIAGPYAAPDDLGTDADLQGLNDTSSARAPKHSANWTGAAASESASGDAAAADDASTDTASDASASETAETAADASSAAEAAEQATQEADPEAVLTASNQAVLNQAVQECSTLVLTPNSELDDQGELIASTATAAGVTTVAGDTSFGKYAAVTLYLDPYAIGYAAGQQVYRILEGKEDPAKIKLESAPGSSAVKLYNSAVTSSLGLNFGKSFNEYQAYLSEHPTGTTTRRVNQDEDSQ